MLHLIDDIIDQSQILTGDILIFDNGKPRCANTYLMGCYLQWGQQLFYSSPYRSSYLHAAICTQNEAGKLGYQHLHYASMTGGYNSQEQRDLTLQPFQRPLIILRPQNARYRQQLIEESKTLADKTVNIDRSLYLSRLFNRQQQMPVSELQTGNTCIGFIINLMHIAANKLGSKLNINHAASTTELLAFASQQSSQTKDFDVLLAPTSSSPNQLISYIKELALIEALRLEQEYFFADSAKAKASNIRKMCTEPSPSTSISDARLLLSNLKPIMTESRILWPSKSFERLVNTLEAQGIYREYLSVS